MEVDPEEKDQDEKKQERQEQQKRRKYDGEQTEQREPKKEILLGETRSLIGHTRFRIVHLQSILRHVFWLVKPNINPFFICPIDPFFHLVFLGTTILPFRLIL